MTSNGCARRKDGAVGRNYRYGHCSNRHEEASRAAIRDRRYMPGFRRQQPVPFHHRIYQIVHSRNDGRKARQSKATGTDRAIFIRVEIDKEDVGASILARVGETERAVGRRSAAARLGTTIAMRAMTAHKDARGLRGKDRFKFALHRLYATVGYRQRVPLVLQEVDGYCHISAPDGSVFRVSPVVWRSYKRGMAARLRDLDSAYLFTALNPPPGPVLDVGAHVGEFAVLPLNQGRIVYAIEPDPDALACLRRNLEDRESVTVIDELVWSTEQELTFSLAASNADSSVFGSDTPESTTDTIRRHATTLDRIAEDHGIDTLAFVKCDAEGAEPEVLEGGRKLLQRTARIAIDTGPERQGKRTTVACEALLRDAGFTVRTRDHGRNVTYGSREDDLPKWHE